MCKRERYSRGDTCGDCTPCGYTLICKARHRSRSPSRQNSVDLTRAQGNKRVHSRASWERQFTTYKIQPPCPEYGFTMTYGLVTSVGSAYIRDLGGNDVPEISATNSFLTAPTPNLLVSIGGLLLAYSLRTWERERRMNL